MPLWIKRLTFRTRSTALHFLLPKPRRASPTSFYCSLQHLLDSEGYSDRRGPLGNCTGLYEDLSCWQDGVGILRGRRRLLLRFCFCCFFSGFTLQSAVVIALWGLQNRGFSRLVKLVEVSETEAFETESMLCAENMRNCELGTYIYLLGLSVTEL